MSSSTLAVPQQAEILCPKCGSPVPLTEALARPLIEATKADYERKMREQNDAVARQQEELAKREAAAAETAQWLRDEEAILKRKADEAETELETQRARMAAEVTRRTEAEVDKRLEERLAAEKLLIAEAEERRAARRYADELAERDRDRNDQAGQIERLTDKLAKAQAAEASLKQLEREFADKERELGLKIEQQVGERLDQVRTKAATEAEERLNLQISDKDRMIRDLAARLEDATRKAQQGSQQAQGETLELLLEEQLRRQFPFDEIQPVPKGEYGGDTLQIVRDSLGRECGRILWEFKRTKAWQTSWLPKLRADQRAAKADLAVIVTQAMPPDVQHFNEVDGIWVSSLACALPVGSALRASLLQLATQRRTAEGQQTKSQLVYAYLTGPQFRGRIEAVAERWTDMQKDLADEKKTTMKRWAKRESQLQTMVESTTGIYGDLQGIAGRDLAEIEMLEDTLMLQTAS